MDRFSVFSKNEPIVMIHKGWKETDADGGELNHTSHSDHWVQPKVVKVPGAKATTQAKDRNVVPQKYEFVNGTTPFVNRDPDVRRIVRAHVVRDSSRKKKHLKQVKSSGKRMLSSADDTGNSNQTSGMEDSSAAFDGTLPLQGNQAMVVSQSSRASVIAPSPGLDPNPQLSPVIYHVRTMGTAMWPLEDLIRFNPISPASWFDWALSDEALFHALLYTTSTYAGLISGTTESKEAILHEGKSMNLVNQRLSRLGPLSFEADGTGIEEGTIGAVSCLAISEALRGNLEKWQVHMSGVKQMVDLKGGLTKLSQTLQLKMHRADLTGALHLLATPFFADDNPLPKYLSISPAVRLSPADKHLQQFLITLPINQTLIATLTTLSVFSHRLSLILSNPVTANVPSQITLLKETYALRYSFLRTLDVCQLDFASQSQANQKLDEILRVGALLYMQATLQELPFAAVGSRNLVTKLMDSVMLVKIRNRREGELMVWLLFMGGIEAQDELDRAWFVVQVRKLAERLGMGWEEVNTALEGLWWVKRVHEDRGKKLWDEVEIGRGIDGTINIY